MTPALKRFAVLLPAVLLTGLAGSAAFAQATPAAPSGPLKLASGVEIKLLQPGRTPLSYATAADRVRVHYEGRLLDGKVFDSSYTRGQPAEFPLSRVVRCWTEGMQQVPVGATAELRCPSATAYGAKGAGGVIPPNADLVFKVELLEILR
jgi:FKBP-type peptidyl-prolyl cis-trans isomerase FkpA